MAFHDRDPFNQFERFGPSQAFRGEPDGVTLSAP
jgi:hypothetical protein